MSDRDPRAERPAPAPGRLREVAVGALDVHLLEPVIGAERIAAFENAAAAARARLGERAVVNVNSAATGGGVAELLQTLLAYARGAGIDARWFVIEADGPFFAVTKRVHNRIYGEPGDAGVLGPTERAHYEAVLAENAARLGAAVSPGDVVVLHDPQTAGLVEPMRALGARVVWRCHIGRDAPNEHTEDAWAFLRPYVSRADACVFTRRAYAPPWLSPSTVHVIPPSIDPLSTKNRSLTDAEVRSILHLAGFGHEHSATEAVHYSRRDGSSASIDRHLDIFRTGLGPPLDVPLVVQISRWDAMKDMHGVMVAFAEHVDPSLGAHLALVGPAVHGVADDPEAAAVFDECLATWRSLAPTVRARVHLAAQAMGDPDRVALVTNAIQRHATVVVQKSLAEGFGLTVAEAMWKGRPVVASRVGGIPDQVVHGETGLLLDDPHDLAGFGAALTRVLADRPYAERLGAAGRRRARDELLADRHLERWGTVFTAL
ncbi:MAG: glycosyltransferase [Actinomycetota bacterium]